MIAEAREKKDFENNVTGDSHQLRVDAAVMCGEVRIGSE